MDLEGWPFARDEDDGSCLTLELVYGQLRKMPDEARKEVNKRLGVNLGLLRRCRETPIMLFSIT